MKKRIVSAFSLVCATALIFDYSLDSKNNTKTSEAAEYSTIAGVISATNVDIASLDALTVEDSDAIATAKSLGDIYGYNNLGI